MEVVILKQKNDILAEFTEQIYQKYGGQGGLDNPKLQGKIDNDIKDCVKKIFPLEFRLNPKEVDRGVILRKCLEYTNIAIANVRQRVASESAAWNAVEVGRVKRARNRNEASGWIQGPGGALQKIMGGGRERHPIPWPGPGKNVNVHGIVLPIEELEKSGRFAKNINGDYVYIVNFDNEIDQEKLAQIPEERRDSVIAAAQVFIQRAKAEDAARAARASKAGGGGSQRKTRSKKSKKRRTRKF